MRIAKWTIVCVVCAGAAFAMGDSPPRKPDRTGPGGERPERSPGDRPGRPGEDDWKKFHTELEKFCAQNAPRRWEMMKKARQVPGSNKAAWAGMALRFKGLQTLEKEDKKLYDIRLLQIQIEDKEFGLLQDIKSKPDSADTFKSELRDTARKYIDARFEERKHRIAKAEETLKKLRDQLSADEASSDRLVAEHFDMMIKEGPEFFMVPRHPRRGEEGPDQSTRPVTPAGNINAAP